MYGLDVNFLNDRPEYKPNAASRTKQRAVANPGDRRPLIFGAIAAVVFPAVALGLLFFLQNRNGDLEKEQAGLDAQLTTIEAKRKEIGNVKEKTKRTQEETQQLAGVFNTVKPLSALMQEIRDRTPASVQLTSIKQLPLDKTTSASAANASASPNNNLPPSGNIVIGGLANSFNDVNDLMLGLQQSRFFDAKATRLKTSTLKEAVKLVVPKLPGTSQVAITEKQIPFLPQQVAFEIQTVLSNIPASELLKELNRNGAVGQVTRIETLQRKGVLSKP